MKNNKQGSDKLGFGAMVFLAINLIIGSGIFLTPGSVVKQAGSKTLFIYLAAAFVASILALPFAAASKYVNKAGASYAYSKAAFGFKFGFYIGATCYFATSAAWGVASVGITKSALSVLGANSNSILNVTVGLGVLMTIITIVNLFGQKFIKKVMNMATLGKLSTLLLIIVAGVILLLVTGVSHRLNEVDQIRINGQQVVPALTMSGTVMAVVSAFYAFTGFESVASGAEDMENPEKNLPRAIPLAILTVALIYIGVLTVALKLNPDVLLKTKQVIALAAIFNNEILRDVVLIGALVSMLGLNFAYSFSTPRILEAMAREKQISKKLTKRTEKNFPLRTYFISAILAIVIPLSFQYNMTNLITLSAIVRFLEFTIVPLAVICFYFDKSKEQVLAANKNIWTDLVLPVLAVILVVFLLTEYNWREQFGVIVNNRVIGVNWYAIIAMIFGFCILPFIMYLISRSEWEK
ncbi:APC family permease [Lactobacillus sp. ESL0785]|uniref:APC family permease n=1 Tax=Lactobacillus sp. ESL0785 TaxID=2983232 RepID=UPI0023F9DD6C|nr:APC family permease [Lactobacillus sp. ESL0785]WEV70825.1 APC family permease [Lactobacillus sp. ESL0785]